MKKIISHHPLPLNPHSTSASDITRPVKMLKTFKYLGCTVIRGAIPIWFALVMTITPLRGALILSDLFTTLLSHGLAAAILLLLMSMEKQNNVKPY